jgi:glycosyltransferase involved in cell wall biosynthesis/peptidoglycan/xylan/chitin deacetylase (PgdA/CDA1 family)
MDRWGEYWRFTDKCMENALKKSFANGDVAVQTFGNVASAKAYIDGVPAEHMRHDVLDVYDNDYQVLVCGVAVKAKGSGPSESKSRRSKPENASSKQQLKLKSQEIAPRVLLYHRVAHDSLDAQLLCVSPENFEKHISYLAGNFNVLPLGDFIAHHHNKTLEKNSITVTFDDGYLDNYENALPILEKYGVHATIFVTTGPLGSHKGFWGDIVEAALLGKVDVPDSLSIPLLHKTWPTFSFAQRLQAHDEIRRLLKQSDLGILQGVIEYISRWAQLGDADYLQRSVISEEQLKALSASDCIEIGAHTVHHANLACLDSAAQYEEIQNSRLRLEEITGYDIRLFAYPYGTVDSFTQTTKDITRKLGFYASIANVQGDFDAQVDSFAAPRRVVRDWNGSHFQEWMHSDDLSQHESMVVAQRRSRIISAMTKKRKASLGNEHDFLNLLYINSHDITGGAAKSTSRLAEAERLRGHKSDLLVSNKVSDDPRVHTFDPDPNPSLQKQCRDKGLLYFQYRGSRNLVHHPLVQQADLLHFQNLHGDYFNPKSVAELSMIKPVMWTLRDMQSITGHCAHSLDCNAWESGCVSCPNLNVYPSIPVDSAAVLWKMKQDIYKDSQLTIVCPSHWLKNKVERSILKDHDIRYICNGVDTAVFRPYPQKEARTQLGLPADAMLIGAVAQKGALKNPWKGGEYTLQALDVLLRQHENLFFVNIGGVDENLTQHPRILQIPHIADENILAKLYSALDIFMYTTIADTCPLVIIEALSCGLPVVSFATGGVPELVTEGEDGITVPTKDVGALITAVKTMMKLPELRRRFSENARNNALKRFDINFVAEQYETLYYEMLRAPKRAAA